MASIPAYARSMPNTAQTHTLQHKYTDTQAVATALTTCGAAMEVPVKMRKQEICEFAGAGHQKKGKNKGMRATLVKPTTRTITQPFRK